MPLKKLALKKRPIVSTEARLNIRTIFALYEKRDLEAWEKFFQPIVERREVLRHDQELLVALLNSCSASKKRGDLDRVLVRLAARVGEMDDLEEELMMNDTERFALRQSIRNANYGEIPLVEWAAFDEALMEFLENGEEDE